MTIRRNLLLAALALLLPMGPLAAGVPGELRFAPDTRWMIHLDGERLLDTRMASYLQRYWAYRQIEQFTAVMQAAFGLQFDLEDVRSATVSGNAYGPSPEQHSVLMVRLNPGFQENLADMLREQAASPSTPLEVEQVEEGIYRIDSELHIALEEEGLCLAGASLDLVLESRSRQASGGVPVGEIPGWEGWGELSGDAVLVAHLSGYQDLAQGPMEWLLPLARAVRLTLGENEQSLVASLELQPREMKTGKRIARMLRGVLALGELGVEDGFLRKWFWGSRGPSKGLERLLADSLEDLVGAVRIREEDSKVHVTLLDMRTQKLIGLLDSLR